MAKSIKLGSDTYLDASGVTVDSAGTTLSNKLPSLAEYVDLGTIPTLSVSSPREAMIAAFERLTTTGKTCIGTYFYLGSWMFMAYKYVGGDYGMMVTIYYSSSVNSHLILHYVNGTYTIYKPTVTVYE